MFINLSHQVGACAYAPTDCARTVIEAATCLQCAKCLLYHCMSDTEGNYVHPCECSNSDGHWARRWIGLSLLSILVPCLCCYVPLMACYKCGRICNLCGGRHEAQWKCRSHLQEGFIIEIVQPDYVESWGRFLLCKVEWICHLANFFGDRIKAL